MLGPLEQYNQSKLVGGYALRVFRRASIPETNRSFERGLAILDCFKPGLPMLSHGELVERTGLPKATVSRLTTALLRSGYLTTNDTRGFRLGVPALSLSRTYVTGSALLSRLSPVIQRVARATSSIAGVAAAHRTDMVYLDQVGFDPMRATRIVGAGQHLPIANSAIGRAYLGGLAAPARKQMIDSLRDADPHWHRELAKDIARAVEEVQRHGYCIAFWNDGVHAAVGAPLRAEGGELFAVNIGYTPAAPRDRAVPPAVSQALEELLAAGRGPGAGDGFGDAIPA